LFRIRCTEAKIQRPAGPADNHAQAKQHVIAARINLRQQPDRHPCNQRKNCRKSPFFPYRFFHFFAPCFHYTTKFPFFFFSNQANQYLILKPPYQDTAESERTSESINRAASRSPILKAACVSERLQNLRDWRAPPSASVRYTRFSDITPSSLRDRYKLKSIEIL